MNEKLINNKRIYDGIGGLRIGHYYLYEICHTILLQETSLYKFIIYKILFSYFVNRISKNIYELNNINYDNIFRRATAQPFRDIFYLHFV